MSKDFFEHLLDQAGSHRKIDQGVFLFRQDDPVKSVFAVIRGRVELTRYRPDGGSIVLQRASEMTVLAEASLYSETYHCDAVATLPSEIFELPKAAFLSRLHGDQDFSTRWAAHLANEVRSARSRCEILSRNTVADRLDGWLAWRDTLPAKGDWKNVAAQIGVSPEALYRELAKRR